MAVLWLDGSLVDEADAKVSAVDRGLVWGDGLFETLRAYDAKPWALDAHYGRLRAGSHVLELPVPERDVVASAFRSVLEANGLRDAGVRITVTRGAGPVDPHADPFGPPTVVVTAWALRDYSRLYAPGAALVTSRRFGSPVPEIKTISYAANVVGRLRARRAGADDTLFVDGEWITETSGSNVFVVRNGVLSTPPVAAGVLPGVTRATVLALAPALGMEPVERPVALQEIGDADEVLLTSTLREVYPVRSVDGRLRAAAGHAARLRSAFRAHVRSVLGIPAA